jgi:hypothetical protein
LDSSPSGSEVTTTVPDATVPLSAVVATDSEDAFPLRTVLGIAAAGVALALAAALVIRLRRRSHLDERKH